MLFTCCLVASTGASLLALCASQVKQIPLGFLKHHRYYYITQQWAGTVKRLFSKHTHTVIKLSWIFFPLCFRCYMCALTYKLKWWKYLNEVDNSSSTTASVFLVLYLCYWSQSLINPNKIRGLDMLHHTQLKCNRRQRKLLQINKVSLDATFIWNILSLHISLEFNKQLNRPHGIVHS